MHTEDREGRGGPRGQEPPPRPPEAGAVDPRREEAARWEGYDLDVLNDLLEA
jgi:hypothetical protein